MGDGDGVEQEEEWKEQWEDGDNHYDVGKKLVKSTHAPPGSCW